MFNKLFRGEQKLFCVFDILRILYEKSLHMFVTAVGQMWLVLGRCLSIIITNTTCTGMWFLVNWQWFTKLVIFIFIINPSRLSNFLQIYITAPIINFYFTVVHLPLNIKVNNMC